MRMVGYARVSTEGQVEDGHGLDIQEQEIRKWARQHHHRLLKVIRDEGVTGTTDEREGLTEAIGAVRYNGADGLVVLSLDRLARSLTVQEGALQAIWRAGGRVLTVEQGEVQPDDPDDPTRTLIRQVIGAVSQFEAAMVALRLRRGRQHKASQGGYAYGRPPYGYRAVDGELVEDPAEKAAISRMRKLRREGKSLREIAEALGGEAHRQENGQWHPHQVKRILDRTT